MLGADLQILNAEPLTKQRRINMKKRQNYTSDRAAAYIPWIAHAVRVGGLVFAGGGIPRDPKTLEIPYDFKDQCKLALDNLEARLNAAGTSLKNGVRVHVWLSDLRNWKDLNDSYRGYIDESNPPSRLVLQVSRMNNDFQVEIDAIAVMPEE